MVDLKINEVEAYLNNKTEKKFSSLRKKAESDKSKIIESLQKIKNSAYKFSQSKDRELFKDLSSDTKKHDLAVKASDKLQQGILEALDEMEIPDQNTYENIFKLAEEIQIFFNKLNKLGRKWVPKMSPWFKQELKEFDYQLRKLVELIQKFNSFIFKEYKAVNKYDKTIDLINSLNESLIESKNLINIEEELRKEVKSLEEKIEDEKKKLSDFKASGIQKDLKDAKEDLLTIRRGFNITINPILKPLKKFSKSATSAMAILTKKQRDLIFDYIENPFNTFLTEDKDLSDIKNILNSLKQSLENNDLELKKSRIDKAIKQISRLLNEDILENIYNKANEISMLSDKLGTEIMESGLLDKREDMKSSIGELEDNFADKKVELAHIENDLKNLKDKIERDKSTVLEKIREMIDEEINIALD